MSFAERQSLATSSRSHVGELVPRQWQPLKSAVRPCTLLLGRCVASLSARRRSASRHRCGASVVKASTSIRCGLHVTAVPRPTPGAADSAVSRPALRRRPQPRAFMPPARRLLFARRAVACVPPARGKIRGDARQPQSPRRPAALAADPRPARRHRRHRARLPALREAALLPLPLIAGEGGADRFTLLLAGTFGAGSPIVSEPGGRCGRRAATSASSSSR